ncbi:MAG: RnfH family protein [Woeseiaceae bacterium]
MSNDDQRRLEVVYGTPERQCLIEIYVNDRTTCGEAVRQSGIGGKFPDDNVESLPLAVWGRVVPRDQQINEGNRIEILRPLENDPRDARRELATEGQYMGGSGLRQHKN